MRYRSIGCAGTKRLYTAERNRRPCQCRYVPRSSVERAAPAQPFLLNLQVFPARKFTSLSSPVCAQPLNSMLLWFSSNRQTLASHEHALVHLRPHGVLFVPATAWIERIPAGFEVNTVSTYLQGILLNTGLSLGYRACATQEDGSTEVTFASDGLHDEEHLVYPSFFTESPAPLAEIRELMV